MPHGIYDRVLPVAALANAAHVTGVANGPAIDLTQFGNDFESALFLIQAATITDGTHTATLQESVDGVTYTPVDPGRVQGGPVVLQAAQSNTVSALGYLGGTSARYVQLVLTTAGATTGGVIGATAILTEGSNDPVSRTAGSHLTYTDPIQTDH